MLFAVVAVFAVVILAITASTLGYLTDHSMIKYPDWVYSWLSWLVLGEISLLFVSLLVGIASLF